MSLLRIPCLFLTASAIHKLLGQRPNPPAQKSELVAKSGYERFFEPLIPVIVVVHTSSPWIPAMAEVVAILAARGLLPSGWQARLLRLFNIHNLAPFSHDNLPIRMLIGTGIALYGTHLRFQAYRTMGRHFTYEVTLKQDHKLVQEYPYYIVRHPSYTAMLLAWTGLALALSPKDGWVRAVLWPTISHSGGAVSTRALFTCAAVLAGAPYLVLAGAIVTRMGKEDKMLRSTFGKQWDDWERRVPYRLIPGVY